MRKDARIGLVLGGIILAVLAVVVMLPGKKSATTAHLDGTTPADDTPMVDVGATDMPGALPPVSTDSNDVAGNATHGPTDPFAGGAITSTRTPSADTSDAWSNLLHNGPTPLMVTDGGTDRPTASNSSAPVVNSDRPTAVVDMGPVAGLDSSSTPVVRTYTVKSGDTLVAISRAEYGTAKHVDLIQKANPQVKDPRKLKIGMVLKIPPLANTTGSAAKAG